MFAYHLEINLLILDIPLAVPIGGNSSTCLPGVLDKVGLFWVVALAGTHSLFPKHITICLGWHQEWFHTLWLQKWHSFWNGPQCKCQPWTMIILAASTYQAGVWPLNHLLNLSLISVHSLKALSAHQCLCPGGIKNAPESFLSGYPETPHLFSLFSVGEGINIQCSLEIFFL